MRVRATIPILVLAVCLGTPAAAQSEPPTLVDLNVGDRAVLVAEDATGRTWENRFRVGGTTMFPTTGQTYWVLETSNYDPGLEVGIVLFRSTTTEVYSYTPFDLESLDFQIAPVGTTWTREYPDGKIDEIRVAAIETVTVPAGTFTDCIKYEKRCLNCSHPTPVWIEWVKPGGFIVKWVDYWVDYDTITPPVVYEMTQYYRATDPTDDDEDADEDEDEDDDLDEGIRILGVQDTGSGAFLRNLSMGGDR